MSKNYFFILFACILLLDLIVLSSSYMSQLRFITKPAITISLLIFLHQATNAKNKFGIYLSLALIFSLVGDIFLLFPDEVTWSFISGLLAFLMAHIMYISAFFKPKYLRASKIIAGVPLLVLYAWFIFSLIQPNLGDLLPYVIVYITVLLFMVLTAFLRERKAKRFDYLYIFSGALLFMISDSLLALNKFYETFEYSDILIMLSYGLAQYLIIRGAIEQQKTENQFN